MSSRFLHGFVALLVLFSSTSFTFSSHFCGGTWQETAIWGEAKACSPECMNQDHTTAGLYNVGCCDVETSFYQGLNDILPVVLNEHSVDLVAITVILEHACSTYSAKEDHLGQMPTRPPPVLPPSYLRFCAFLC
jgi:hypothetical protein